MLAGELEFSGRGGLALQGTFVGRLLALLAGSGGASGAEEPKHARILLKVPRLNLLRNTIKKCAFS